MSDTDVNAVSQSCERIECVRNNSDDDSEEWVEVTWPTKKTGRTNSINSNEDNCGYYADKHTNVLTSFRLPFLSQKNKNVNQRQQPDSAIISEDTVHTQTQSEESDDISIITDSDIEGDSADDALGVTFHELCEFEGKMCGPLMMHCDPPKKSLQGGFLLNLILACSLGVLIGLAVSRILFIDDICSVSRSIDISSIKTETDSIINSMKNLKDVKKVLDEIKESIPHSTMIFRHQKRKHGKSRRISKGAKILDINSFQPTSTLLNQLQISFKTLSSTIKEIDNVDVNYKIGVNRTQNILSDLHTFHTAMANHAKQLQCVEKPVEARFLQSANDKIRRVSETLLSELSHTVYVMTISIFNQFDTVRYKLNKQFCCLKSALPNSESISTKLDKNNIFFDTCEKIFDIRCNTSEISNSKHKWRREDGRIDQEKANVNGDNLTQGRMQDSNDHVNNVKNESGESSKSACSSNKSINPTILGPQLPEDICLSPQTRSLYSEVIVGKVDLPTLNESVSEKINDGQSRNTPRENTATTVTNSVHVNSISDHAGELLIQNNTKRSTLDSLSSLDFIEDVLNLFDELPENSLTQPFKKKKKSNSFFPDKKAKNKFKRSGKNHTRNKRDQKNESSKYNKNNFSSTYDKRQSKEKYQPKYVDGDWQFKRSSSRENQRFSSFRDIQDPPNWYFNRARSRKNARDNVDNKGEFQKSDAVRGDWVNGREENHSDDWLEKKRSKYRKRPSNWQRSFTKNTVDTHDKRNVLQTGRY